MTTTIDIRLLAARKPLEELRRDLSDVECIDDTERALIAGWAAKVDLALAALDRAQQEADLA